MLSRCFAWFFFFVCAHARSMTRSISNNAASSTHQISMGAKYSKGSYRFTVDSKICETTPGVKTYSGYVEVGNNQSMFFWFFQARNNPRTAPFALWLNGGPGCSSMIGIFQENGGCKVNQAGTATTLNPYSWNEHAHMIYVDQPITTGFSYGNDDVNSTAQAAPHLWDFFQILFSTPTFSQYQSTDFIFASESYGGHYAPKFSEYFQAQNALIKAGKLHGRPLHLTAIAVNNGWFDPYIQYLSYYDYAQAKYNGMFDLVDQPTLKKVYDALHNSGGCLAQLKECSSRGNNNVCKEADAYCSQYVSQPIIGDRNPYYFPRNQSDQFPSESYTKYLARPEVLRAIGAETKYEECADNPNTQFTRTGDDARSTLPSLVKVLNSGLRTIIWAGDKDFICNTLGGYRAIFSMQWKYGAAFRQAEWKQLSIQGEVGGIYKTAGPLTYITVFDAGHEVAAYKPELALEVFRQIVSHEAIHSVEKQ